VTEPQEYPDRIWHKYFNQEKNVLHQVCVPAQMGRKKTQPNRMTKISDYELKPDI